MDDVIEERIDDILFNFDFMTVADTRKYLKLNIHTMDEEEKFELMKTAKRLLKTAVTGALREKEDYHCATGSISVFSISEYHSSSI